MQYSREVRHENYSSVEVITVAETVKMIISAMLLLREISSAAQDNCHHDLPRVLSVTLPPHLKLYKLILSGRKMFVLVVLYSASNYCSLYANGAVGASVATVVSQLKVLTTAICGVSFLGKSYSTKKWICLLFLTVGSISVSYATLSEVHNNTQIIPPDQYFSVSNDKILGFLALVVQIWISGFAAVYFEFVLKDNQEPVTVWERNFQLAVYSIFFTLLATVGRNLYLTSMSSSYQPDNIHINTVSDGSSTHLLFSDWTLLATIIAFVLGGAGLCVAGTIKYADAVVKCFANCIAIIFVTIWNMLWFRKAFNPIQTAGIAVAITAMIVYTLDHSAEEKLVVVKKHQGQDL